MTKPILTATEYEFLCCLLDWCWTSVYQEPELCLKDINYMSSVRDEEGNRIVDPIKTGECGLGLAEKMKFTLDEPNAENIHIMITNLIYKLNANDILSGGHGNTWETLAPIVDNEAYTELLKDGKGITTQTLENYNIENIGKKNKISRIHEFIDDIEVKDNLYFDIGNSDL
jgi:hypothetical protein